MLQACFALLMLPSSVAWAEDLSVFPKDSKPENLPRAYLHAMIDQALSERQIAYEALKTEEQIRAYQDRLRRLFIERLGGFPERTPLRAKTVGTLKSDGFRIEKIIFESRPNHSVTALLYLPDSKPPYPAVLIPCGHTVSGKASNQRLCTFFAKSGMAAFTYDPIGQGERFQLLDPDGKPLFGSTTEHTLLGVGSILVGRNTASYRIWDGIRALDYLESRKEIDATKLGCTGVSGGGTLTEYLMALDPRIACAAPACAPTTFARRMVKLGPGDAEQNIFGQIQFGLDHADYTILRAPKPTLLLTATQDFVDIQGSWDLFRETKRIYSRLGYPERVDLVEADAKHGFSLPLRTASVRWMRRWLLDKDDAVNEPKCPIFPDRRLLCTEEGQVLRNGKERSVADFNMEVVEGFRKEREELWRPEHRTKALAKVRSLAGIRLAKDPPKIKGRPIGHLHREGYNIEKLLLEPEDGVPLPALRFQPKKPNGDPILYVHGLGKHHDAEPGGPIEKLVRQGHVVLAIDLSGTGETGTTVENQWGGDFKRIFMAYLLGKSTLGMRAEEILLASRYLAESEKSEQVRLVAVNLAGPPALHAVALEQSRYSHLTLRESPRSWIPVIRDPTLKGYLVHTVHGALKAYDLSDLIKSLPEKMLTVERSK